MYGLTGLPCRGLACDVLEAEGTKKSAGIQKKIAPRAGLASAFEKFCYSNTSGNPARLAQR